MKKAILVVSFGTSFKDTLKATIGRIEDDVENAFPDLEVRRAFTSRMIVKKIKERDGLHINNTEEAIQDLVSQGYNKIYVQPLHIIPGYEYEKIKRAVNRAKHHQGIDLVLGHPLLYHHQDYLDVVEAMVATLDPHEENTGYLLMGHGTEHPANASYVMLERLMQEKRPDVHFANVEGYPELEDIKDALRDKYHTMTLMPFMLVAGDHARNDMASDEEDSFKSQLEAEGISTRILMKGLGEYPAISDIFIKRIHQMMD